MIPRAATPLVAALVVLLASARSPAQDEQLAQGTSIVEETKLPPGVYLGSMETLGADGNIDLTWGGRIEYDTGWFATHDGYPVDAEDGTEFRRLRLRSEGYLYRIYAKLEVGFASGKTTVQDAFLSWDKSFGRVQVGRFKEPTSLDNQTSGNLLTFMERGLPVTAFTQLRNTGVMLSDVTSRNVHWQIGAFVESDSNGQGVDPDGAITVARLVLPWRRRIDRVFHLGAWVSHRPDTNGVISYKTRPEAHLVPDVAETGDIPADGATATGLELAWTYGPYSLQSEWIGTNVDANGMADPWYYGWYVYTSYFLTGENRNYEPEYGAFGRVRPDVDHTRGLSGAWEVALRYSTVDLDDGPSGDVLDDVTLGLNWYWNPQVRISLNYIHSDYENHLTGSDGTLDAFMIRFHADW